MEILNSVSIRIAIFICININYEYLGSAFTNALYEHPYEHLLGAPCWAPRMGRARPSLAWDARHERKVLVKVFAEVSVNVFPADAYRFVVGLYTYFFGL